MVPREVHCCTFGNVNNVPFTRSPARRITETAGTAPSPRLTGPTSGRRRENHPRETARRGASASSSAWSPTAPPARRAGARTPPHASSCRRGGPQGDRRGHSGRRAGTARRARSCAKIVDGWPDGLSDMRGDLSRRSRNFAPGAHARIRSERCLWVYHRDSRGPISRRRRPAHGPVCSIASFQMCARVRILLPATAFLERPRAARKQVQYFFT